MVVSIAILVSMFVSLTLTPMMASRLLGEAEHLSGQHKGLNAMLERGLKLLLQVMAGCLLSASSFGSSSCSCSLPLSA
jgi:multidrug efflux pump subunit AcrB